MLPRLAWWTGRSLSHSLLLPPPTSSTRFIAKCLNKNMGVDNNLLAKPRRRANFRLCNVSCYTSEVLEIQSDAPTLHVLFVPGNPGVILFYKDFVEFLYELLEGTASVTAIGHVSHSRKIDFIREELENVEIPILLVGHSIGSYISIEMFKKSPEKVKYCIGLYPFLTLNPHSTTQLVIGKIAKSQVLAAALSYLTASLGLLPVQALRFLVRKSLGKSWSANAVEAACSHLSQISKHVPGMATYIERENHTHGFCCTEAGSLWVAQHVVNLIKNQMACSNQ
ncbi:hypothetical protein JHK85_008248 [Glycine max]|nr:hypothetical protein JHK85_008248 [Glycine max]